MTGCTSGGFQFPRRERCRMSLDMAWHRAGFVGDDRRGGFVGAVRASPDRRVCPARIIGNDGAGMAQNPPARRSPSTMTETLAKIGFLKGLGAHTRTFDVVPIEKQRAYGQRIQAGPEAAPSASHGAVYFTLPRPCPNPLGLSCCGLQHCVRERRHPVPSYF